MRQYQDLEYVIENVILKWLDFKKTLLLDKDGNLNKTANLFWTKFNNL